MAETTTPTEPEATGAHSEGQDLVIALGVLLFMAALGAWLMWPEQARELIPPSAAVEPPDMPPPVEPVVQTEVSAARSERSRTENSRAIPLFIEQTHPVAPTATAAPVREPLPVAEPVPVAESKPLAATTEPLPAPEPDPAAVAPVKPPAASADLLQGATSSVSFVTGSAVLTEESQRVLDELAALLIAEPANALRIVGHTDAQGSRDANAELSFARAEACRDYLLAKGVTVGRIDTAGFGERKPVASNATPAGRERNRRVEFLLGSQ